MTAEQVAERVRVHAALADPARLRITDHLAEGDASPGELQALLAMPSNLLAHHLRVLEQAGVVARRRSEADRRRSYVRLLPDTLGAASPRAVPTSRVLFVCTANSARSQLAAALWTAASEVPVASAGTHPARSIASGARRTARRHGLRLAQEQPRLLDDVAADGDYVVAVCDRAYEELEPSAVRAHWSVPDPVRVGRQTAFEAAYDDLAGRVARLAPRLTLEAHA